MLQFRTAPYHLGVKKAHKVGGNRNQRHPPPLPVVFGVTVAISPIAWHVGK